MKRNYTNLTNLLLFACILFAGTFAFKVTPQLLSEEQRSSLYAIADSVSESLSEMTSEIASWKESVEIPDLFSSAGSTAAMPFANEVKLVKGVNNIGGGTLLGDADPGQNLIYSLQYENRDAAPVSNYVIVDTIPVGINYMSNDGGGTYDPATRVLTINVGNLPPGSTGSVNINVQVVNDPIEFSDPCSSFISNQAYGVYNGGEEPSYLGFADTNPAPATFFVNSDELNYTRTEAICGTAGIDISATDGFDSYTWTRNGAFVGNTQTITASQAGTYVVEKTVDCNGRTISYTETVNLYNVNGIANPILNFADDIGVCPNNGDQMPNLLLCGTEESRTLNIGFTSTASSITWKKQNAACTTIANCANASSACWTSSDIVGTGDSFTVTDEGSYRVEVLFSGNSGANCLEIYYFNVYKDQLNASVSTTSFSPSSLGTISIDAGGVGPEYTYEIDGPDGYDYTYGPTTENSHTFKYLIDGDYTVTVTSDSGCSYTEVVTVTDNNPLWFDGTLFNIKDCNRARIRLQRGGGDPPYQFAIWSINGVPKYETFQEIPDSAFSNEESESTGGSQARVYEFLVEEEGDYVFVMRDDSGNFTVSGAIPIALDPAYRFDVNTTDVLCYGGADGSVSLYFYSDRVSEVFTEIYDADTYVYGGVNTPLFTGNASGTYPNLTAGDYIIEVTITLKRGNATCSFIRPFTIYQPDAPLEAYAGVITDVSCIQNIGASEVKISNASGGTPPYRYIFNGVEQASNIGYLANDGTVTVVDANGCTYDMFVDVNAATEIPSVDYDLTYNCDGTGNVTLIPSVADPDLIYIYEYSMNGGYPVRDSIFADLAPGNYNFRLYYENATPDNPTPGLLLEEDFGTGENTTLTEINPVYDYESQVVGQDPPEGDDDAMLDDGEYVVTSQLQPIGGQQWIVPSDADGEVGGRYLAVNIGDVVGAGGIIYEKLLTDISSGSEIIVDLSLINLLYASSNQCDPDLIVELLDVTGRLVDSQSTGAIDNDENWHDVSLTLNSGGNSQLRLRIRSNSTCLSGNDIAIDGIRVYQTPEICTAAVDVPVVVQDNEEFTGEIIAQTDLSCYNMAAPDGTVTFAIYNFDPATGYEYSVNGGPWIFSDQAQVTINDLGVGNVTVDVRNPVDDSCDFSMDASAPIGQPQELLVTGQITQEVRCDDPNSGTLIANAEGGTPPYQYAIRPGSSSAPLSYSANNVFSGLAADTYEIFVIDANGCEATTTGPVTFDAPIPLEISVTATECYDGSGNAQVVVTADQGNGNYQFSINGNVWNGPDSGTDNQYTLSGLSAGTYTVYVRDGLNCTADLSVDIAPQLTISATAGILPSCGGTAEINATANGGDGNYVYAVVASGNTPADADYAAANNTYTVTAAGSYDVYVRDNDGNPVFCETFTTVTVSQDAAMNVTLTETNIACNGGNNGTITVNVTDGTPPYAYSIDGGTTWQTSNVFNNLAADSPYTVTVRDSEGCLVDAGITLTQPDPLTITPAITAAWECTNSGATITVTATGRTNPADYEFSLNGGAWVSNGTDTYDFTDVTEGTHTVRVRDAVTNTCVAENTITVDPLPEAPELTYGVVYNCDGTGDLTITATPNDPSYTYQLDAGAPQASNVFAGLAPGTYTVTVDYGSSCTTSIPVTIDAGQEASATVTGLTHILCNGGADGSLTFEIGNYDPSAGYQYRVNGGAWTPSTSQTVTVNGLTAGAVTVEVQFDAAGSCVVTLNETITEPAALNATATATDMTCNNGENATITVDVTGGTGPFEYSIDGGTTYQSSNTFTITGSANAGTYTIDVRDTNACATTTTVAIIPNEAVAFTLSPVVCAAPGNSGEVSVAITAGNGGYTVSIDGGPFVTPNVDAANHTFTNISDGTHTITVRDAYGCEVSEDVTLASQISATASLTKELDCSVSPDGEITVNISGGFPDFTYQVSVNGGAYGAATNVGAGSTSFTYGFANPAATTTYQFQITDSAGCTTETGTVTVEPITDPVATHTVEPISCASYDDGVVIIDVDTNFGTAPYTISFDGSAFTAQTVYTGLAAGTYTYTVMDSKGCTYDGSATIDPVDPIVLGLSANPVTCDPSGGDAPGSVDASITSGGVAPFTYYLYDSTNTLIDQVNNTTATTVNFAGLDFGFYYVQVIDANGCESTIGSVNVLAAPFLDLSGTPSAPDCVTGATVTLFASTGSGDYSYEIYGSNPVINENSTAAGASPDEEYAYFNGLTPGVTYIFKATDNVNGCTSYQEVTIPSLTIMDVSGTTVDVTCNGSDNGILNYTISDYDAATTQLNYEVVNRYSNSPVTGPGTYTGTVPADASGTTTGTITDLPPGDYTMIVTEDDGTQCSATFDFRIEEPTSVAIELLSQTNANCNIGAEVVVRGSGGTAPYTYAFVQDGVVPAAGDYTSNAAAILDPAVNTEWDVYVMDANGCTDMLDVTIAADPVVTVSITTPPDQCAAGSYTFTALGTGAGTLEYSIGSGFQTSGTFTVNAPGTYTVTVRDENGCTDTADVEIYEPLQLDTVFIEGLDCEVGDEDAKFSFEISGGTSATLANMTYSIDGPAGFTDISGAAFTANPEVFTGANVAGDYLITVVDNITGCTVDATVTVPPLVQPSANVIAKSDVSCFGAADGAISVSAVDNGIGPFTFEITAASDASVITPIAPTTADDYNAEFTGLAGTQAGITYTITATSVANSCETTVTEIIYQPEDLTGISVAVTPFACTTGNAGNAARIVVSGVTGGTGNYTYEFINTLTGTTVQNGPDNELIWSDVAGGNFDIAVTDENGCSVATTAVIDPFVDLVDVVLTPTDPSCNNNDGEILADVTLDIPAGGSYTLTYELFAATDLSTVLNSFAASTNVQETFTGLSAGSYVVRVTNDVTGCYLDRPTTLTPPDPFGVEAVIAQDIACLGDDALVDITVTAYSDTYTWEIFNAADNTSTGINGDETNNTGIAVGAGDYYVTVTQTAFPFCSESDNFSIVPPPAALQAEVRYEDPTCIQGGFIEIFNVSGGWGNYQYYIGTSATPTFGASSRLDDLAAGTYYVAVTDDRGCVLDLGTVTLADPMPPVIAGWSVPDSCDPTNGFDLTVSLDPSQPGLAPYTLMVDNLEFNNLTLDASNSFTVSGLTPGDHVIRVIDANGCEDAITTPITITPFEYDAELTAALTCVANAEITIDALTGSGDYLYQITFEDGTVYASGVLPAAGMVWTGADQPGTYTISVSDNVLGCSVATDVVVPEIVQPTIDVVSFTDPDCSTGTGSIVVNAPNTAIGPYTFEIIAIDGAAASVAPDTNDGYTAVFNNVAGNTSGITYTIQATAQNGCTVATDAVITSPEPVVMPTPMVTHFSCNAGSNAYNNALVVVDPASITGGSGTYVRYEFEFNGVTQVSANPEFIVTDTRGGTGTVTVYDSNNCSTTRSFIVDPFIGIENPQLTPGTAATCLNGEDITVSVDVYEGVSGTPGTTDLQFILTDINGNPLQSSPVSTAQTYTFTDLAPGAYFVTIVNTYTGCELSLSHIVEDPDTFVMTAAMANPACYGEANGSVTLNMIDTFQGNGDQSGSFDWTITGITDPAFSLSGSSTSNTITIPNIPAGHYQVDAVITSAGLGCSVDPTEFTITEPLEDLTATIEEVANVTCTNDKGEIYVDASGGYPYYEITLVNSDLTYSETHSNVDGWVFLGLSAGIYTAYITDQQGCTYETEPLELIRPEFISAEITGQPTTCFGSNTGEVSAINVTGGAGPDSYFYELYDELGNQIGESQEEPVFTELAAGFYYIKVRDPWDCDFDTELFEVLDPEQIAINETDRPAVVCYGTTDGYYEFNLTGGTAPYTVELYHPDSDTPVETLTGVGGGETQTFWDLEGDVEYRVVVTDANTCTNELTFSIPTGPDLSSSVNVVYECSTNLPVNYIEVTLTNASISPEEVLYALNTDDINQAVLFDEVIDGKGIIRNVAAGADQFVTIFYEGCAQVMPAEEFFEVVAYEPLEISLANEQLNLIEFNATGGTPPYTYYVNGEYRGTDDDYRIRETGTYEVVVVDANGCENRAEIFVEFYDIEIPNFFTPDGDSNNDVWGPANSEAYPSIKTRVYDRYGRVVGEMRVGQFWDGKYNGSPLPTGDYWYVITFDEEEDAREFVGHFTLYR